MTRLDHMNVSVADIEETISVLQLIAPDFKIRRDATDQLGTRWVHIGNKNNYLALEEQAESLAALPEHRQRYGMNHLAFNIKDFSATVERLAQAGYEIDSGPYHETYRTRGYFSDKQGFQWELVEYLSDQEDEMHYYE